VREVPDLLQQPVVQSLQFLEIEDLEALMSVLGSGSLAHLLDRKIQEAGPDTDVQQWFHDSPLAPRPTQTAMVEDRSDRLLDEIVTQLGFDREELERLRSAPPPSMRRSSACRLRAWVLACCSSWCFATLSAKARADSLMDEGALRACVAPARRRVATPMLTRVRRVRPPGCRQAGRPARLARLARLARAGVAGRPLLNG
jgi:hypothetical protein